MTRRPPSRLLLALALLPGAGAAARAQDASGAALATGVLQASLAVSGLRSLDFGRITPTMTVVVPPTSAAAGQFLVQAAAGSSVGLVLTLPTSLGTDLAVGAWTGRTNVVNDATTGALAFAPASGATLRRTVGSTGTLYVFLGATLTATGAAPGSYSRPIVLNVAY